MKQVLHELNNKHIIFLTVATVLLSFFIYSLFLYSSFLLNPGPYKDAFNNSDALYLIAVIKNIFMDGGNIYDWKLPPSSYIFPDLFIHYIAFIFNDNPEIQLLVYSILQLSILFLITFILLRLYKSNLIAISISAFYCAYIVLIGIVHGDPYNLSFIGAFHFGSFLSYLILLILFLCLNQNTSIKTEHTLSAACIIVSILSLISDNLVVIYFFIPIFLLALKFKNDFGYISKLLIISIFLSIAIKSFLLPQSAEAGFGLSSPLIQLEQIIKWFSQQNIIIQLNTTIFFIYFAHSSFILIRNKVWTQKNLNSYQSLQILTLTSFTIGFLAIIFTDRDFSTRYILPFFFLPTLLLFITFKTKENTIFSVLLGLILMGSVQSNIYSGQYKLPLIPEFVACVEKHTSKHNVTHGAAQYWDAVPLNVFNKSKLVVAPLKYDLSPMDWIVNKSVFNQAFSFAVIDNNATGIYKISNLRLVEALEKQPYIYECKDKTVYVFNEESIPVKKKQILTTLRNATLESFIQNPRSLLIMSNHALVNGDIDNAKRLFSESIALLKKNGADKNTIKKYFIAHQNSSLKKKE